MSVQGLDILTDVDLLCHFRRIEEQCLNKDHDGIFRHLSNSLHTISLPLASIQQYTANIAPLNQ